MHDILQDLVIAAPPMKIFEAISSPCGMNEWWTKECTGEPKVGSVYTLWFGPKYDWRGTVTRCVPGTAFELEISHADEDWNGTKVGFELTERKGSTQVCFHHIGWPEHNEHFRTSNHCWAMYLRILRRYLEHGESVPYEERLEV